MKNQNDLIAVCVAFFVFLIVAIVAWAERPQPVTPAPPEVVNVSEPMPPSNTQPVLANALPGGGSTAGGGGGNRSAGPAGVGAPPSPGGAGGGGGVGQMSIGQGGAQTKAGG